jgi:hypothetical protein
MKNKFLISLLLLAFCACDKDNDTPANPVSQLPPATQIGANTFGCLLDGAVFKPGSAPNSLNCYYQFVDGEYYFHIAATKNDNTNNYYALGINTAKKSIVQGEVYQLYEMTDGNVYGLFFFNLDYNYTSHLNTGQLTITKFNFSQNIISGTFFYDILGSNGVVHQIRDGRFDMHFTQ